MHHIAMSNVLCSRSLILYFMTLFIVQDCNQCAVEAPASWMAAVHQTLRKYGVNIAVDTAVRTISRFRNWQRGWAWSARIRHTTVTATK